MKHFLPLVASFLALNTGSVFSQNAHVNNGQNNESIAVGQAGAVAQALSGQGVGGVTTLSSAGNVAADDDHKPGEYIVKFKEAAASTGGSGKSGGAVQLLGGSVSLFDQLRTDLSSIQSRGAAGGVALLSVVPTEVKTEYHKAFFGAHVIINEQLASEVARLSYVENVFPNRKVEAFTDVSVPLIGADDVWAEFDTEGEGIVVGIIDTGIDYSHPDLGGGFGDGFKVVGGYDFVNNDADPMDDHQHGTHVAGIVAANGPGQRGVAPGAQLVALKALNQWGYGYDSDILEAIEWAVDPNGDGDTSDKLDVVNMSLGGPGDDQSPLALAVDAAVEMGVVFCVAAGNDGRFRTIGSPGTARRAITVGATDDNDVLASFSSKGPNRGNYAIKPDLLAPGVNINSTVPGGGFASFNGTSMATPHVAGVVALLKSIHPDWTPDQLKSALTTTARDLGLEEMQQGSGRMRALEAARMSTFSEPTQLSFGLHTKSDNTWEQAKSITIVNKNESSQTYSINYETLPAGVTLSASAEEFVLASGQSISITFSLKIDNAVFVQDVKASQTTSGRVAISGTTDQLAIPWGFVSGSLLTFKFEDNQVNRSHNKLIHVYNEQFAYTGNDATFSEDGLSASLMLPAGTYSAFVLFEDWTKMLVREGLIVDGNTTVNVTAAEAKNKIDFDAADENGQSLRQHQGTLTLLIHSKDNRFGYMISYGGAVGTLYMSDMSTKFFALTSYTFDIRRQAGNRLYHVQLADFDGLSGSRVISRTAAELRHFKLNLDFPGAAALHNIIFFVNAHYYDENGGGGRTVGTGWSWGGNQNIPAELWQAEAFVNEPAIVNNWGLGLTVDASKQVDGQNHYMASSFINASGENIGIYDGKRPLGGSPLIQPGQTIRLGGGLLHPSTSYWSTDIRYLGLYGQFNESTVFFGSDQRLKVTNSSGTIIYDGFSNEFGQQSIKFSPDVYIWELSGRHQQTNNSIGTYKVTSRARVQYENGPFNAPVIKSLYLAGNDGILTNEFRKAAAGKMVFSVTSAFNSNISKPTVFIRESGEGKAFQPLAVMATGEDPFDNRKIYQANIQYRPLADTYYDMKVTARGAQGDSVEYLLHKAFYIRANIKPSIAAQKPIRIGRLQTYAVKLSDLTVVDPDSDPSKFSLEVLPGDNYSIADGKITTNGSFVGILSVPVKVKDEYDSSAEYLLKVEVFNAAPEVVGQVSVNIDKNSNYTISLADLTVVDPDDLFPNQHSLRLLQGPNYTIDGLKIVPSANFGGDLVVNVRVKDGYAEGPVYPFKIKITNVPPLITGQQALSISKGASIELTSEHLMVEDPDNAFPSDFSISVVSVSAGSVAGNTIKVPNTFKGTLDVQVKVSDGADYSNVFVLSVEVTNEAPVVTGQTALTIAKNSTFSIGLDDLVFEDGNDTDFSVFSLHLESGDNYSITSDGRVTPKAGFSGELSIPLKINDGVDDSAPFLFEATVQNERPAILGNSELTVKKNTPFSVAIGQLDVVDTDDDLSSLQIEIFEGENYSFAEGKIVPSLNFAGTLTVNIAVADLYSESETYHLPVEVINAVPVIVGQQELSLDQNSSLTLLSDMLLVEDEDDTYPEGFVMRVGEGSNYSVFDNSIEPNEGFFGVLSVPVTVSDEYSTSQPYDLQITVLKVNGAAAGQEKGVVVFPLPVQDFVHIRFSENIHEAVIQVADMSGQTLLEWSVPHIKPGETMPFALEKLTRGIYVVRISSREMLVQQKIIKD